MPDPSMPAGTALTEAIEPVRAALLLREPGVAASIGLPEFSVGPARLLDYWIAQCPTQEWRPGGRPVVFTTTRKAAAQLHVSEQTARRHARGLRDAGAWTPVLPPGSGPKQGIDLSPLATFIPRLVAIRERLRALRQERRELTVRQRDAAREANAHVRRMLKAGLLSDDELLQDLRSPSPSQYLVPDRYRPQGWGSIESLEWQTGEQRHFLARIEAVEARLQRIQEERAPQTLFPTTKSRDRTAAADAGAPSRNASRKERYDV